ncbi:patatin-like phospholipase family protein [bacterium]|nr:patatin-like phospholipase family protein [bacterium]
MKKIGLVLGGGGARCFAHLGVIEVLQNNNIPINCIVSSSMGSIIGALIANEVPIEDIKKEFFKLTSRLNWFKPAISKNGFISQSNIKKILKRLLVKTTIENSKISLFIVATNLNTAELNVFERGNIVDAVCASSAFPGIYPAVTIDNNVFVDGGVLNNIPADVCRKKIGKNNIVTSSILEGSFYTASNYHSNPFSVVWRSIYIPLIKSREEITKKDSDIILEPLKEIKFDFHNWKDILKFYNVGLMEDYYQKGKKEMQKKLPLLKKLLNEEKNESHSNTSGI